MFSLIENEVIKMISKKRLLFVLAILVVLISVFAYGQKQTQARTKAQLSHRIGITATDDWRKLADQQLIDMKNRLDSPYIWKITRYMFMVNLRLTDYLSGSFQPIEGMTMIFSITVLLGWTIASIMVSFVYFTKQDILV